MSQLVDQLLVRFSTKYVIYKRDTGSDWQVAIGMITAG